uniref:Synaptonemal complex protein 1 n=1 Tax=Neogobius melanostomus TaxID=47308 RepID=A0A8C6T7J3_9GOBI
MDRERGFSFKLLVPPRVSHGQVSAVRPQEVIDNRADFLTPMQQGFTKCFNKEQQHVSNKSILGPTKPKRQDCVKMKVVSPMEKENDNNGQLYTKLFDEVEKIKFWKVKTDSDSVEKERRLYENKRTIETQRKAIQELQFSNESLSIKLEEQISENDELRNRNNATRNLCNILKDTFERSVEKMHLFECEREEIQHLILEYQDTLQKQIEAFEALHFKAEANNEELLKAKEVLMRVEDLKNKFQQECNMKEKEVEGLQTKLKDNDNKLNNISLDLQETKVQCRMLQEEIDQKSDLLKSSSAECDSLCQKLQEAEQRCRETEQAMAALVEKNEEAAGIIQRKDLNLQELSKDKTQLTETLEQIQLTADELKKSLAAETQKAHELEDRVTTNLAELEKTKNDLGEMRKLSAKKEEQISSLMEQLDVKTESMKALNSEMIVFSGRAEELTSDLLNKTEEAQQLKEACDNAEKGLDELKAKFTLAQVHVDELQTHLTNEKRKMRKRLQRCFSYKERSHCSDVHMKNFCLTLMSCSL